MTEQNVDQPSDMALLAAARHIFEINVWLWLMVDDPRFSLIFYRWLITDQIAHNRSYVVKLEDKIQLFMEAAAEDGKTVSTAFDAVLNKDGDIEDEEIRAGWAQLVDLEFELDKKVRRKFCLYARQAAENSYEEQAELIAKKAIPAHQRKIDDLIARLSALDAALDHSLPDDLLKLCRGKT